MEDSDGNKYTDFQNIYYVCSFDPVDDLKEATTDCGGPKVAKTHHSDDPDKKCFGQIYKIILAVSIMLIGV